MSSAPLNYTPQPDAAQERELDALAVVYRFILDCRVKKQKGGPPTAPDDAKKESKHVGARDIIPE